MRKTYYCPNCRSPIYYGEKFCGNCGTSLKWMVVNTPPLYPPSAHGYPGTFRQGAHYPQPRQYFRQPDGQMPYGQRPAGRKNAAPERQAQPDRQNSVYRKTAVSTKKHTAEEDPGQVLLTEVTELLEHLFQKPE
jgi:hypothetical protein